MKGEKFMKIIVFALLCVAASYMIFSVTRFSGDAFTTYKAVRYEVGDGITTSGFLVRSEQALRSEGAGIIVPTRSEGEKVGKGQTLALSYRDEAAKRLQAQIDELEAELAQMRYAHAYSATDADSASMDTEILHLMNQITLSASRREYTAAEKSAEELKPYVLRRYLNAEDAETLWERITAAQARLDSLYEEVGSESGSVKAPVSGWFSGVSDGLEDSLTPEFLETATVAGLEKFQGVNRRSEDAVGKLVTSQKWYFAAIVPSQNVAELEAGDRIEVNFAYDFYGSLKMKVERISPSEDDRCILVLSSESYIQYAVTSRTQTADLVFADRSGLRVPKTAIYATEDGQSGVYVLEGAEAKWKTIHILYDNGDSFIVELDKSSTKNLWPEDEIILTTGEIFNGKVMVK